MRFYTPQCIWIISHSHFVNPISAKNPEPVRSQFGEPDRVLDIPLSKIRLKRARVMAGIGLDEAVRKPAARGQPSAGRHGIACPGPAVLSWPA
jgi:hypothetical protein